MKLKLEILDKIFQPFFTTIPIVPIAIGIGMKVETKEGQGLPAGRRTDAGQAGSMSIFQLPI